MTQEDKELLFKDLSMRLPYQVYIQAKGYSFPIELRHLSLDTIPNVKPYLRPMSSMTEEEEKVVNNLIYNKESIWTSPVPVWVINESNIEEYVDFCNSHYLDWRGLIPKGLALEAKEWMYKTE